MLQFTWTLLMLVAWLWLATLAGLRLPLGPRVATLLFGVALAAVFATPAIYLAWPVTSIEHRQLLTWLMRFGGGLAILPLGLALVIGLVRAGPAGAGARRLRAALWASLGLFAAGGAVGVLIQGSNGRVPADYHRPIVGGAPAPVYAHTDQRRGDPPAAVRSAKRRAKPEPAPGR